MSVPQTGATILIFCVCGTYIFITIVLLAKFLLQYCCNQDKHLEPEIPNSRMRPRQNPGARPRPSYLYGIQPTNQIQRVPPPVELPPDFNEALNCPSPTKVAYIHMDDDDLPSYSDYEKFYASLEAKEHETELPQMDLAAANHEISINLTELHTNSTNKA